MPPITIKKKTIATIKASKSEAVEAGPTSETSAPAAGAPAMVLTTPVAAPVSHVRRVVGAVFAMVALVAALIFGVVVFMQWTELQSYRGAFLTDPRAAVLPGMSVLPAVEYPVEEDTAGVEAEAAVDTGAEGEAAEAAAPAFEAPVE